MKVNGHQIQKRLQLSRLEAETYYEEFTKNTLLFTSQAEVDAPDLDKLHARYVAAENKVCLLYTSPSPRD